MTIQQAMANGIGAGGLVGTMIYLPSMYDGTTYPMIVVGYELHMRGVYDLAYADSPDHLFCGMTADDVSRWSANPAPQNDAGELWAIAFTDGDILSYPKGGQYCHAVIAAKRYSVRPVLTTTRPVCCGE